MYVIENFSTSTGKICITNCISDILNSYGCGVNESIIFATSGAKMFYYKPINIEEVFYDHRDFKLFDLVLGGMKYDIYELLEGISSYWGLTLDCSNSLSRLGVKEFIKTHIHENRPILSLLSRKNLGYMKDEFRDEITHAINIIGEKENADKLYISDGYIPTVPISKYVGEISFEEYYISLISAKDIFKKNYSFKNMTFIAENVHTIDDYSVDSLLAPVKKIAALFLNSCVDGDVLTGRDASCRFLGDFDKWLGSNNENRVSNMLRYVHHRIANFGGPVITNLFLAEYFEILIKKDTEFIEIYDMFMELHIKWRTFANLAGKASFFITETAKVNLVKRLVDVLEFEEKVNSFLVKI